MRLIDFAVAHSWAILPEVAPELVAIADRAHQTDPRAFEAYRAQHLDRSERAGLRGDVAILYADGPMFKRANLMVEISGATSYEILRRDLQAALDNPKVNSILMVIDSPGGEVSGCDELAAAIYQARGRKPITAYVSGLGASAAYWVASAADRIVVSDAAMLGSIGVVIGLKDRREADERRGVKNIEFVSSQSPGKRPDPSTDGGRESVQAIVDGLADVFISAVAKYRGVSTAKVLKDFGAGGVKIGAAAVRAGMADEVGQLEATLLGMQRSRPAPTGAYATAPTPAPTAITTTASPAASAPTLSPDRIRELIASEAGRAMPALASVLAFDTALSAADALGILEASRRQIATMESPEAAHSRKVDEFIARKRAAGGMVTDSSGTTYLGGKPIGNEHRPDQWKQAIEAANERYGSHL